MMSLYSAFTAADTTDALAAGNTIAEMSLHQCVANIGPFDVYIQIHIDFSLPFELARGDAKRQERFKVSGDNED